MNNGILLKILIGTFCLIAIINCVFLAIIFLNKRPFKSNSDYFISFLLFALTLRISKSIFFYLFDDISSFYISIGLMGKLAIGPFLFFFIQNNANSNKTFKPINCIHFLPALILITIGWSLNINQLILLYWIGTAILTGYVVSSWYIFIKNKVENVIEKSILIGTSVIWLTFVFQIFSRDIESYTLGAFIAILVLYWLNYKLFVFTIKKFRSGRAKTISAKKNSHIKELIDFSFDEEKIYRDPKLTLSKLAEHINQPIYITSLVINNTYNKTFPEFVNYYRVEALKKELHKYSTTNYTIEGMAFSVGFNTPSAFYAAFKKEIGITPQEYIEQTLNKVENCN